tara:strand:+ start:10308 stop:11462 length:1155 start_codon:yes stop_codon:yes gene_type:complete
MPYFSFIVEDHVLLKSIKDFGFFELEIKYYSKDTKLWSFLNKKQNKNFKIQLKKEQRLKAKKGAETILFCLPPSLGLGDTIEYGLAIKSIIKNKIFKRIGIAYVGKFNQIFKKLFNIENVYDYITEKELKNFDTSFHFTLEIDELIYQKYNRQNIEKLITDFFNVPLYRKKIIKKNLKSEIKKISIFPLSNSPLRTLPLFLINFLIEELIVKYQIEIYLDKSKLSNYIFENIKFKKNLKFYFPKNFGLLINKIKKIQFGIFPDSGPLHVAKILNKKGILFISSVKAEILLDNFKTIKAIESNYISSYCHGPCGLVNAFEFKNKSGCYDSLNIKKGQILKSNNLNKLQRGNLMDNYLDLYIKTPNCYKNFDDKKIKLFINEELKN